MRLALAADHAGFQMKHELGRHLAVIRATTCSTSAPTHQRLSTTPTPPKPWRQPFATDVPTAASSSAAAAPGCRWPPTRFPGIRAAVCHDTYTAHQAVEHDDMNVLCLGARVIGIALALDIVAAFLSATFSGEPRHTRRLDKVLSLESRYLAVDGRR